MNIELIDATFNDIANKKQSGAISPDTRNRYYNLVNIDLFKLKAGLPENYNPFDYNSFQSTFKISDDVRKFMVDQLDINRNTAGYFPYPPNYGAFDYMLYGYIKNNCKDTNIRWKSIEAVIGIERAVRLDSHLLPPTKAYPIVRWTESGWGIDPDTIKQIRVSYLRLPRTPFRAYTLVGDKDVFNPIGSVNTEWADTLFGDFVIRVCKYAGIELREQELFQFAQQRTIQGQ